MMMIQAFWCCVMLFASHNLRKSILRNDRVTDISSIITSHFIFIFVINEIIQLDKRYLWTHYCLLVHLKFTFGVKNEIINVAVYHHQPNHIGSEIIICYMKITFIILFP